MCANIVLQITHKKYRFSAGYGSGRRKEEGGMEISSIILFQSINCSIIQLEFVVFFIVFCFFLFFAILYPFNWDFFNIFQPLCYTCFPLLFAQFIKRIEGENDHFRSQTIAWSSKSVKSGRRHNFGDKITNDQLGIIVLAFVLFRINLLHIRSMVYGQENAEAPQSCNLK